jgi:hypothetical protein
MIDDRVEALERKVAELQAQLDLVLLPRHAPAVVYLKQAAAMAGTCLETQRRKALHDPHWRKRGGRWVREECGT